MEFRNCEFKFKCPEDWDSMSITDDDTVRHCEVCERNVYLCQDESEIIDALKFNRCVAIPVGFLDSQRQPSPRMYVGELESSSYPLNHSEASVDDDLFEEFDL
ncbi:hypothetical protein [Thalassotalea euphylliae]|uniref:Uncharacterized protein n=1 Tax=Thalassotalea euphylliae TaxID=1655234 RepID=A0A3E0UFR9_9GAMM|nr:hypothetical protein [Thalassotalea euphylliae]REL35881.1 hypothetical protein DXX92_11350 [Thalassotalea euphylliae]